MGLLQHLEELRKRILYSMVAVGVTFVGCWPFHEEIAKFLEQPLRKIDPEIRLSFLGLADPLFFYLKVTALVGVFVASPIILYQVWRFVSPGLYRRERRWALAFVFFGSFFFLAGGGFAYYVAFPFATEFLLGMGQLFQPTITIERYFRFLMTVILGLALMFELPVLIFLLSHLGLVTPRFLMRKFRWAVLMIFTVAAIITPTPDVFNLCLFAVPTIFLYLLGVGAAALVGSLRRRSEEQLALPEADEP